MAVMRKARATLLLVVFALTVTALSPAGAVPTFSETVVAGGPSPFPAVPPPAQTAPEIDGRYVVYEYAPNLDTGLLDVDVLAYDVGTGQMIPVSDHGGDNDTDQMRPDVSMDTVVYQSSETLSTNIFLFNISWSDKRQVTNETPAQTGPRISGRHVLWHDAGTDALKYYPTYWPQYMNQQIPGTVAVYPGSWDIDGDTVVFARNHGPGMNDFTFYTWTLFSDAAPEAFGTHLGAEAIADVRLHNGKVVYTYGGQLNKAAVMALHSGTRRTLSDTGRDPDVFHDVYALEVLPVNRPIVARDGAWSALLGAGVHREAEPSVFGHRVAYQRDDYNGDIILARGSEPLVDRTSGPDRYATAVAVSKQYFSAGADAVVLCTGENFPDALAAAPWARFLKAPVLLTRRTVVPDVVMQELMRLGAKDVWIVGGDSAVSSAVTTQLEAAGLSVDRQLQGVDRYATSAKIATFLFDALMADGRPFSNMAFVARGDAFPDALSVAPLAASTYSPIILVRTTTPVPQPSAQLFQSLPIWYAYIVGGEDVVSVGVEEAIEAWTSANLGMNSPATRFEGSDRYATSVSVLQNAVASNWLDLDTVGFATGLNFPDALGGGAALGSYGSPLLLTRPAALPQPVSDVLAQRAAEIGRADIFGGADVVNAAVMTSITNALK